MKAILGRIMAFDWGLKNIGIAVGNNTLGTSEPLTIIRAQNGATDFNAIAKLINEWRPEQLLVGEPLNMDGSKADITPRAHKFSRQLKERFNLPVTLVDERLSSREAKLNQRERGHRRQWSNNLVDAEAADIILRTWLSQNTENS